MKMMLMMMMKMMMRKESSFTVKRLKYAGCRSQADQTRVYLCSIYLFNFMKIWAINLTSIRPLQVLNLAEMQAHFCDGSFYFAGSIVLANQLI